MFLKRQTEGSVICTSCGVLVGVNDDTCYNCGRRNPGLWGYGPALRRLGQDMGFVPLMMGTTITLYALSVLMSRSGLQAMLAPSTEILFLLGASGSVPVIGYGRWWTFLTAGWLHGGVLHVLFNVLWIRQLAPAVADMYGPARMAIIYVLAGAAGFALTTFVAAYFPIPIRGLSGAPITVGASANIFGLLGATVYYGRRTGSSIASQTGMQYALILGLFGFISSGVDNMAHAGGFLGGYLVGQLLDPLRRERIDQMVIALGLLVISFIALAWSVITALPLLLQA